MSLEDVKRLAARMGSATTTLGHADGFSALGVATALLLGVLARERGGEGQEMSTSMLSTMAHALSEDMVEYAARAPMPTPDQDLYGLAPLYRLYAGADDTWLFLAAPDELDWAPLSRALDLPAELRGEDDKLAVVLVERFAQRPAADWEATLSALDVACVEVSREPVEDVVWLEGGMGEAMDIITPATHPVVGEYLRLKPLIQFSHSPCVVRPAPLVGEHTEQVVSELGYDADAIAALREDGVLG
jgi:crotonobetainyl-CoA:carnitine CoA-transferase CaiB-like acyl-CoA transferase